MRQQPFYAIDHSRAEDGYPLQVGQYRTAEKALEAVAGHATRRAYERTEENGRDHDIAISPAVPEEAMA